jgi:hypothetical protein
LVKKSKSTQILKCDFCPEPAVYDYEGQGVAVCEKHHTAILVISANEAIGYLQDLLSDSQRSGGNLWSRTLRGLEKNCSIIDRSTK